MVHIEELVQAFEAIGHEVVVIGPAGMDGMKFGGQPGIVDHLKRLLPRHVYELLELVYNTASVPAPATRLFAPPSGFHL